MAKVILIHATGGLFFDGSKSHLEEIRRFWRFIKIVPENPVLWMGLKGASAESRKKQTRC